MEPLAENLLVRVCSKIMDPVTTTDELIPSGETSSYRSNPLGLAEFTLSRRDPGYVGRSKTVATWEKARLAGGDPAKVAPEVEAAFAALRGCAELDGRVPEASRVEIGSTIYAVKPGDGSAREQAASCQRVIGGLVNVVHEFATKRYRSNVMNWGMVPLQLADEPNFEVGDWLYIPGMRSALEDNHLDDIACWVVHSATGRVEKISLYVSDMTPEERQIVLAGCLINYNRAKAGK